MLKDSLLARVFIVGSIYGLRAIAPLSIGYCICRLSGLTWTKSRLLTGLADTYAASESVFFLFVYLPRKWWLNRPAVAQNSLPTAEKRKQLFLKTLRATTDPRGYLSGWFKGVSVEELRREDVKDFISWRLWNRLRRPDEGGDGNGLNDDENELDEYVAMLEERLLHTFPPGRSGKTSMAVTFEPLPMVHRPLIWYLVRGLLLQYKLSY